MVGAYRLTFRDVLSKSGPAELLKDAKNLPISTAGGVPGPK